MKNLGVFILVFVIGVLAGALYKPYQMMIRGDTHYVVYNRITGNVKYESTYYIRNHTVTRVVESEEPAE